MAIVDIFEEVSEKAITKTETGENRIFLTTNIGMFLCFQPFTFCVIIKQVIAVIDQCSSGIIVMPEGGPGRCFIAIGLKGHQTEDNRKSRCKGPDMRKQQTS